MLSASYPSAVFLPALPTAENGKPAVLERFAGSVTKRTLGCIASVASASASDVAPTFMNAFLKLGSCMICRNTSQRTRRPLRNHLLDRNRSQAR